MGFVNTATHSARAERVIGPYKMRRIYLALMIRIPNSVTPYSTGWWTR